MPRWSVIMPVLNGEPYVESALRSTLRWLPRDAEVRVLDDGSADSTGAILHRVARDDRRVVVARNEQSCGVARGLNSLASGGDSAFVGRMDADDVCLPGRWARGEAQMKTVDFAFTSVVFIDERSRLTGIDQPGHLTAAAMPYHLLLGSCLVHPTAMMRRDAFEELGGYAITPAEDYELWLRAADSGVRISRTAVPGLAYRRHASQLTSRRPWKRAPDDAPTRLAYRSLATKLLGLDHETADDALDALTHNERIDERSSRAISTVLREADKRAEELPWPSRMLVRWRIHRIDRQRLIRRRSV